MGTPPSISDFSPYMVKYWNFINPKNHFLLKVPDGSIKSSWSESHSLSRILEKQIPFNFSFSSDIYIRKCVSDNVV
jgi:hypothetical protein